MAASDRVHEPSEEELARIRAILRRVGGEHVTWGASSILEVLMTEKRLTLDRLLSGRLIRATWALAFITLALVLATVALIIVTANQ